MEMRMSNYLLCTDQTIVLISTHCILGAVWGELFYTISITSYIYREVFRYLMLVLRLK
jgi:hypothetical protein